MLKRWTRLLPIMMITYMIAFLDRTNIGFAIPDMARELHFTPAVLGFSSGVLFFSYAISQPFAGLVADRGYGKSMVAAMMVLWGLTEIAQGLIQTPLQLIIVRGLLGLFEGCLMATFLLFVCNWFTAAERSRANGLWFLSFPVAAMLSGPIAGYVLSISSWRMLFIVSGALPILWCVVWLWGISESPRSAPWLSESDRNALLNTLEADANLVKESVDVSDQSARHISLGQQIRRPSVLIYTASLFLWNVGFMGFIIWLPSVLHQDKSLSQMAIGWLASLPFLAAIFVMLVLSYGAGKARNRRMFAVAPIGLCGVAFVVAAQSYATNSLFLNVVLMVIAGSMLYGSMPILYSIPGNLVPKKVTASVVGVVNGFSALGDFLGPYVIGYVRDITGTYSSGLLFLGGCLIISSLLLCYVRNSPTHNAVQIKNRGSGVVRNN